MSNDVDDVDKLDTSNLSDELKQLEEEGLQKNDDDDLTISDKDLDDDDDNLSNGDTWIEELECALLADCDPGTLKKICEGKRIPATLRPDYWKALLSLNDAVRVKLNNEYDLENQLEIRQDCDALVEDIATNIATEPISEADKLRLRSDFESCLTTYVKARPELSYIPGNGWTDIMKVLYHLHLNDVQLYQMFFRIVDRYIPRDLSYKTTTIDPSSSTKNPVIAATTNTNVQTVSSTKKHESTLNNSNSNGLEAKLPSKNLSESNVTARKLDNKSIQAYHLLRLLIQYHDPELCSILDSKKVTPNLYVKDWFCSLFARSCTTKLALLIWDTHFKMADPFLIFFAAIVMVANASDELKKSNMTQEKMLNVLNEMPSQLEEDDIEDLYYLVSNHYTNSTPRSIRSYSHLFFMDTFANTYSGNENPEDRSPLFDLKTSQLTSSLDLSQYLCLPIVPAEIFTVDTAQYRSSPTQSTSTLKYFLVDCRPAEQYNAGHLARAFHLDCSLMLREPSSFATAVQALLEIQRQVVASKSNTGGQHVCFIGSGQEEEDQYVNMVVASFLQKYQKYVCIVVGGFDAIHDYVSGKSEFKDSFNKYIVDHDPGMCKTCYTKLPEGERLKKESVPTTKGSLNSAQSLFASTTNFLRGDKGALTSSALGKLASSNPQASATANLIAQSGVSMFDKFTTAFVSKSSVIKDRLVETLNTTNIPTTGGLASSSTVGTRGHVSSQDKLGKRYTGNRYAIDDKDDDLKHNRFLRDSSGAKSDGSNEPIQEIQLDVWEKENKPIALYKCSEIKGNSKYPGFLALTTSHMWILREIPHNKGFASIAAKRPLNMIVQITSKRRQPDLIIFRYGYNDKQPEGSDRVQSHDQANAHDGQQDVKQAKVMPTIVASDQLHIPQAFEVIRLIKREIVRIMDEGSPCKKIDQAAAEAQTSNSAEAPVTAEGKQNSNSAPETTEPEESVDKEAEEGDKLSQKESDDKTEVEEIKSNQ